MFLTDYVLKLISKLNNAGFDAYAVGGCVRDSLLGLTPCDWDVCTSAKPDEMHAVFKDYPVIDTGIKHGTVTVIIDGHHIEVTTFRDDGAYSDKRHPDSVRFLPHIDGDLARRDFTINAMAFSPDIGIIDLYGGKSDLENKILRCVGNPERRFTEDALRIMRALRFSAVYSLDIEPETAAAMRLCKNGLSEVSGERIHTELEKLLAANKTDRLIQQFSDVLAAALSLPDTKLENTCIDILPDRFPLRLSALCYLFHKSSNLDYTELCQSVLKRLKTDNNTKHYVMTVARLFTLQPPATLADTRRIAGQAGLGLCEDYIVLKEAMENTDLGHIKEYIKKIKEEHLCCSVKDLAVKGSDFIEAGMSSGTDIGRALDKALNMVIDENLPNDKKIILSRLFL